MRKRNYRSPRVLLIGPYDPHCGEYTFLAPPLGVWRLQGYLSDRGIPTEVFDPNLCVGDASEALRQLLLTEGPWSIVGVSTTGMTLVYDRSEVSARLQPAWPNYLTLLGESFTDGHALWARWVESTRALQQ